MTSLQIFLILRGVHVVDSCLKKHQFSTSERSEPKCDLHTLPMGSQNKSQNFENPKPDI